MTGMIVFFIMIISIVCMIQPEIFWSIKDGWKNTESEPSDKALLFSRIIGVLSMILLILYVFSSCGA